MKIKSWCMSALLSLFLSPAYGSCVMVTESQSLPLYIRPQQCFELQGGNIITSDLNVQGKLFIKAGRKVTLAPGKSITIKNGGILEIRGEFIAREHSALNIDHMSSFNNSGLLYLAMGAQVNTRGKTSIKNIGKMLLESQASLTLTQHTTFKTSGTITLDQAAINISHESTFNNSGTLEILALSHLNFKDKSSFVNAGKTNLSNKALLSFSDHSKFISKRQFTPYGFLLLTKNAIFENLATFRQQAQGQFKLADNAQLLNNHTLELSGTTLFTNGARILNDGVLVVKKGAQVKTEQLAVMINTGTFRNEGGSFTIDNQSNFINENIVSGEQSRSQGRNRL